MAEEKKDTRPWWAYTRIQGIIIMAAGIAMLFIPVTNPVAGTVIAVGAGWAGGGLNANVARKKYIGK